LIAFPIVKIAVVKVLGHDNGGFAVAPKVIRITSKSRSL
jgi:hypothetical protein